MAISASVSLNKELCSIWGHVQCFHNTKISVVGTNTSKHYLYQFLWYYWGTKLLGTFNLKKIVIIILTSFKYLLVYIFLFKHLQLCLKPVIAVFCGIIIFAWVMHLHGSSLQMNLMFWGVCVVVRYCTGVDTVLRMHRFYVLLYDPNKMHLPEKVKCSDQLSIKKSIRLKKH